MADQQPGDEPAAGARSDEPALRAPDKTKVDGGVSTFDAPVRWTAAAAVPPPGPKKSRWLRRFDRFARTDSARTEPTRREQVLDRTAVDPEDWSSIPAVDPWAGQDTPWEAFPLSVDPPPASSPPPPPVALKPPVAPKPPAATPRPAGSAAAPTGRSAVPAPPVAGQRAAETPPAATPRRRWGWGLDRQPKQPPVNRLPVQPRPTTQPPPPPPPPTRLPTQPSVKPSTQPPIAPLNGRSSGPLVGRLTGPLVGRLAGRPTAQPIAPAATGRPVPTPRPWTARQPERPWAPPPAQRPPLRPRRRGRRFALLTVLGLVFFCGVPLAYYQFPAARQYPVTAALPKSFADLSLRNDSASRNAANRLARQLHTADPGSVFAGVYGDSHGKRVTIFGVTGWRFNPGGDVRAELDRVDSEFGLSDIQTFDVGEAGAHEGCGVGRSGGAAVVVCAWADHGSLATVLLTRRSLADSADLVARLRGAVLVPAA